MDAMKNTGFVLKRNSIRAKSKLYTGQLSKGSLRKVYQYFYQDCRDYFRPALRIITIISHHNR